MNHYIIFTHDAQINLHATSAHQYAKCVEFSNETDEVVATFTNKHIIGWVLVPTEGVAEMVH